MPMRVAFPGSSCHPLSPVTINGKSDIQYDDDDHVLVDEHDQLMKICNRKLDTIDTSFLNNPE